MTIFISGRQHSACNTVQLLQHSRLIQHLREKCDFRVFPFCQVVQKHKLFEVELQSIFWLHTLLVTSLPKIVKIRLCVCYSYSNYKVGRFLRHGVISAIAQRRTLTGLVPSSCFLIPASMIQKATGIHEIREARYSGIRKILRYQKWRYYIPWAC